MELYDYYGHTIRVTLEDGDVVEGYADLYESALDNSEGKETLSILPHPGAGYYIDISEADVIKEILIVD